MSEMVKYLKSDKFTDALKGRLEKIKTERDIDHFVSCVRLEVAKNPKLQGCTKQSILEALINAANQNLVPNHHMGYAYLVPRKIKGVWNCLLWPGYKGYQRVYTKNGYVLNTGLVTLEEFDKGRYTEKRGTEPFIDHRPLLTEPTEKNVVRAYVIVTKQGQNAQICTITKRQIEKARSSAGEDFIWNGHYQQMVRKTVIHRLSNELTIDGLDDLLLLDSNVHDLKNVTPEKQVSEVNALLDNVEPQEDPEAKKRDEILLQIEECKTPLELKEILQENSGHLEAMKEEHKQQINQKLKERE